MKKWAGILPLVTVVLLLGNFSLNCSAQSKSLEDLQAELRAGARRDMGLDSASSYSQPAIKLQEKETERSSEQKQSEVPRANDMQKTIALMAITAVATALLMKIFGTKKKRQPPRVNDNDAEAEHKIFEAEAEKRPLRDESGTKSLGEETAIDIYEKIERVQALRDKGVLSEEEFSAKKKELLGRI